MRGKCLTSNTENCKNCYKCIRHCPIKAISFENGRASIINEDCILCGTCFNVCPQQLKVIRDDTDKVKELIRNHKVVVSLAPSYVAYYHKSFEAMKDALLKLGFSDVEETALGATIVKNAYDEMLNNNRSVLISSCCHSINLLIQKYHPECTKYLADVLSPMEAHGLNIIQRNPEYKVVFIGPCISKKDEADNSSYIDYALTFKELDKWLAKENIELLNEETTIKDNHTKARFFPEAGGILKTMACENPDYDYLVVDGIEEAVQTLKDIEKGIIKNCFIEMSACKGSCVNGPLFGNKNDSTTYKNTLINAYAGSEDFKYEETTTKDITINNRKEVLYRYTPDEKQIEDMLIRMNKEKPEDRLNCGCCGYDSCYDKAIAIIKGYASIDMCLPLLMEKSKSLTDIIVNNTPNGLMALDEDMNIQLINRSFCRMINLNNPNDVIGKHIAMILDPSDYYDVLEGKTIVAKKEYLSEYDRYVEKTVSYDEKFKLVVIVMRDISSTELEKQKHKKLVEDTVSITDSLIEKNMMSVHEIASLLGETAAETKVALEKLKSLVEPDE